MAASSIKSFVRRVCPRCPNCELPGSRLDRLYAPASHSKSRQTSRVYHRRHPACYIDEVSDGEVRCVRKSRRTVHVPNGWLPAKLAAVPSDNVTEIVSPALNSPQSGDAWDPGARMLAAKPVVPVLPRLVQVGLPQVLSTSSPVSPLERAAQSEPAAYTRSSALANDITMPSLNRNEVLGLKPSLRPALGGVERVATATVQVAKPPAIVAAFGTAATRYMRPARRRQAYYGTSLMAPQLISGPATYRTHYQCHKRRLSEIVHTGRNPYVH